MSGHQAHYDVVIVGGGPGGAALGTLLASSGLAAVLLEKGRYPRDKPCGGLISGRGAEAMQAVFGQGTLERVRRATSTRCRMFYQGRLLVDVTGCGTMSFVSRRELDAFLIQKARDAGCTVSENSRVVAVDPSRGEVSLSDGRAVRGAFVVGADGVRSVVRQSVRRTANGRTSRLGFGLVAQARAEMLNGDELREACTRAPHVYFGVAPWGYGWIFPAGNGFSIGVGGPLNKGVNFRRRLARLVHHTCREGTWERLAIRGHPIPFSQFERAPGCGSVLLIGDAAGLVEPVTGEGIPFALESARLAAAAILEALAHGTPRRAGRIYNTAYRRRIRRHLRHAALMRWLFYPAFCLPRALRSLERDPGLARGFLDIVSGKLSYPAYLRRVVVSVFRSRLRVARHRST